MDPSAPKEHMTISMTRRNVFLALAAAVLGLTHAALAKQQPVTQQRATQQPASPQPPAGPTGFTTTPSLTFRGQEIAADFGVGYAVVSGDVNGDKLMDILAISGTELV